MKFDVAIMNPPYSGNLHLKILEKIIPVADEVVNISPIRWLQDPLAKHKKNSDYNKFEESISKHISELKLVNGSTSNEQFDINWSDLAILKLDNEGGYDYENLTNNWFKDKILNKLEISFQDVATKEAYRGEYNGIFGVINSHYGDMTSWIKDDFELFCSPRYTNTNKVLFFETEDERRNCFDFLNLKVMKFYAMKCRSNQRVPWQFVPYLDYSQPWTNERFCKYFGITGFISDTEAEPDSEWEEILNIMEKYK